MNNLKPIKAILFDLDGTLRDSRDAIYGAIDAAFRHHDIEINRETYKKEAASLRGLQHKYAPEVSYDSFRDQYDAAFGTDALDAIIVYEHAIDVLEYLQQQGYKMAIVSSSRYAKEGLDAHGLTNFFEVIVGGNDVNEHKPHPEPIFTATQLLGVRADETVMVGDMVVDIEAGKAAGVHATIGLTHGFGEREDLQAAGADHILDSLSRLPKIISKL